MDRRMSPLLFSAPPVINRRAFLTAALGAGILVLRPHPLRAQSRTYYVDPSHPNASDSNAGTSETAPWATFGKAMGPIPVAGDTVYFKTATYDGGSPGVSASFRPTNAGTASQPIAFRRYPGHTPRCTRVDPGGGFDVSSFIQVARDYLILDGFTFLNGCGIIGLPGVTGCIIENCTLDGTVRVLTDPLQTNASVINLNAGDAGPAMTNWIIRNNRIGGCTPGQNNSSIMLLNCSGFTINNNELYGGGSWINMKRRNQNHVIEKNFMRDSTYWGISIGTLVSVETNIVVRYNVMHDNGGGDAVIRYFTDSDDSDMQFYNNTIYNGKNVGVLWAETMIGSNKKCYNNIIVMNPEPGFSGHFSFGNAASAMLIDYNDYYGTAGPLAQFHTALFGANLTFAQWQATNPPNPDAHSFRSDPLFVGPVTGSPPPVNGFQLQAGSPLINAGRVGGVVTGSPINMGAFLSNSDVIGPGFMPDTVLPGAPSSLTVR